MVADPTKQKQQPGSKSKNNNQTRKTRASTLVDDLVRICSTAADHTATSYR